MTDVQSAVQTPLQGALQDTRLPPEGEAGEPKPAAPEKPAPREVARLKFLDPASISKEVMLGFPFEWDGREVRSVRVRRLTVAEMGAIVAGVDDPGKLDLYAFYAVMTDLPAEALRGLIDDDGDAVTEACSPFLPRLIRDLFFGPTREAGGATP